MNKKVINEINQMKFLFGYKPGKVISEQDLPEMDLEEMEVEEIDTDEKLDEENVEEGTEMEANEDFDVMDFEDIEMSPEVAPAPTREREKTREKEREDKPFRPSKPDRRKLPYEDPDTRPQGRKKMMSRFDSEMDENIYEIEIDTDIEELFKKK
jgi:hypothetical protein